MKCEMCNTTTSTRFIKSKKFNMVLCNKCYQRNSLNSKIETIKTEYGKVSYNSDGKPVCHICNKAYKKLMSHVHQCHGLSAYEYKKEFGLETTKSIMSKESIEIARKRNLENYEKVVTENLIQKGEQTRFKKGCKGRTKDMVSKQTRDSLRERFKMVQKIQTLKRYQKK